MYVQAPVTEEETFQAESANSAGWMEAPKAGASFQHPHLAKGVVFSCLPEPGGANFFPLPIPLELRARVPGWAVSQAATDQRTNGTATNLEGAALTADPTPLGLPEGQQVLILTFSFLPLSRERGVCLLQVCTGQVGVAAVVSDAFFLPPCGPEDYLYW